MGLFFSLENSFFERKTRRKIRETRVDKDEIYGERDSRDRKRGEVGTRFARAGTRNSFRQCRLHMSRLVADADEGIDSVITPFYVISLILLILPLHLRLISSNEGNASSEKRDIIWIRGNPV